VIPRVSLIRFYKPYGVLSQFRDPDRPTLAAYLDVPGVYPAGRLDRNSEGLLLLTDDGRLQARIAHPRFKLPKHYWVQVEAQPDPAAVERIAAALLAGVALKDGVAAAANIRLLEAPALPPRDPPVTPHRDARSSWLEVVLTGGRNRQVRRMLAAVGLPVLRLHRARIGSIGLAGLEPGEWEIIEVPREMRGPALKRSGRSRSSR